MKKQRCFKSIKFTVYIFIILTAFVSVRHSFFTKKQIRTAILFEIDREGKLVLDYQDGEVFKIFLIDKETKYASLHNIKSIFSIEGTVIRKRFVQKGMAFEFIPPKKIRYLESIRLLLWSMISSLILGFLHYRFINTSPVGDVFAYICAYGYSCIHD